MKPVRFLVLTVLMVAAVISGEARSEESPWQAAGKVFGQAGKALPGDVQKYSWPRSDLHVVIGTTHVQPALALGSWAAFKSEGNQAMTMGDLVLLGTEVKPVV